MPPSPHQPSSISRREFLAATSGIPAASLIRSLDASRPADHPPWYSTIRRCGQLNYNEKDPLNLDVEGWMDYWASLRVDAVLLNGGGIVAFYPTEVPYHHRSQFLGSRDVLGEMVHAAKRRGIRAVARMDPNLAYQEAVDAHPEWFQRNRDGSVRRHEECPWLHKTCMFSTYFTEQMPAIYREINRSYPVDGFFTNGWPSTGALEVCHCDACQAVYREEVGGTPPETTDASSHTYRRYYEVYMDRVVRIWSLWQRVAQEKKAEAVYVGNLGGGVETVKSLKKLSEVAAWFNADHQGRSGSAPVWICAQQGRVARSVMNGRTITNVTGAYSVGHPQWRHTSKSPAETRIWLAQTVASGMVPWFHWLGGSPQDDRWRRVGREFYQWLAANEPHFRNRRSLADIAVLYPQSTIAFYRRFDTPQAGRGSTSADSLHGLYYALLEGRFLFDFVHQESLSAQTLSPYRVLLIPNAAYLRDSECGTVRQYVRSGGSVLATFETSRYNEWGDAREDLGLGDVLAARVAGEPVGPHSNAFMRIEQRNEITAGFEGTGILPAAEYRLPVRPRQESPAMLTVIPNYPAFPPEMVYPRTPVSTEPAATFQQDGPARVAYFAGDVDRTFWVSGNPDLGRLIHNTIRWLCQNAVSPVEIEGQGLLEIFAWETDPGYALHLLNYTNPNTMRGPLRSACPLGPLRVRFRSPRTIRTVRALKAGASLSFKQQGEQVGFVIPIVEDYEVIALTE